MHLCAAKWINENWMGTDGALLWVSLSLFHSQTSHTLALFPLLQSLALASGPEFLFPWLFCFNYKDWGKWGEMARLYLNGDSQSASCIIMRSDISIHTKLFLFRCTFVHPSEAEYPPSQPDDTFPTHLFFILLLPQNIHTILFFPFPFFSVNARVPCFPLGCPVGCMNVPWQLCNIISWVVASCSSPLHNLPATVHQSMRVFFLCLFEVQIWSPNGDDIKLGAESETAPPPTQVKPFHLSAEWPFT